MYINASFLAAACECSPTEWSNVLANIAFGREHDLVPPAGSPIPGSAWSAARESLEVYKKICANLLCGRFCQLVGLTITDSQWSAARDAAQRADNAATRAFLERLRALRQNKKRTDKKAGEKYREAQKLLQVKCPIQGCCGKNGKQWEGKPKALLKHLNTKHKATGVSSKQWKNKEGTNVKFSLDRKQHEFKIPYIMLQKDEKEQKKICCVKRRKTTKQAKPNTQQLPRDIFRNRLNESNLRVQQEVGDGSCLFRALSRRVTRNAEDHAQLREAIVDYIARERSSFEDFVPGDFDNYVAEMRKDGTWGGELEIAAFSRLHDISVHVWSAAGADYDSNYERPPSNEPPLDLSYHDGSHYNTLLPRAVNDSTENPRDFDSQRTTIIEKNDFESMVKEQERLELRRRLQEQMQKDRSGGSKEEEKD